MSGLIEKLKKGSNSTEIEFNTCYGPVKSIVVLGEGLGGEDCFGDEKVNEALEEIKNSNYDSLIYVSKLENNNYPFISEYNEKGVTIMNIKAFEDVNPNELRGFKDLLLKKNPSIYEGIFGRPSNECRYIN